ncbi:uncharacterized protein At4g14100-like isoform X2 [Abrus precatorius]|uniref:Uncharacterized protein At4g14100-like isoform X2 n=1 Tax=Abrus precatorius TaxID=3816 RepID=A0A8B8KIU2_ABRPR|nr:uncharacterized protein At4g14100-like isoform X2 [Abrus precatorius]
MGEPIYYGLLLLLLFLFLLHSSLIIASNSKGNDPIPADWPHQFHSVLFINRSGSLQKTDLWYDWPNGRNFNIIQHQLGVLKYDLEWNNGTSFIYTLPPFNETCKILHFDVVDFIWYYEDVGTRRPVKWIFFSGMVAHVMTFEVGAVLEDENWQAPVYCFVEDETQNKSSSALLDSEAAVLSGFHDMLTRELPHPAYAK